MGILKTIKKIRKGIALVDAEEQRLIEVKKRKELMLKLKNECKKIKEADIKYMDDFIESVNLNVCSAKLVDTYREINRLILNFYVATPTLYYKMFECEVTPNFDRIYIRNGKGSVYVKSLTTLAAAFEKSEPKQWPPKSIDLGNFIEVAYIAIYDQYHSFKEGFEKFKAFYYSTEDIA